MASPIQYANWATSAMLGAAFLFVVILQIVRLMWR